MAKSQETFSKKEKEKKRLKKRLDKEQKKEDRKVDGKGRSFEDMIAYVDEFGNITSTPPDPTKRKVIDVDQIVIGATSRDENPEDSIFEGKVTFFNNDKGYGFIKYNGDRDNIFVHINNVLTPIADHDLVTFEVEHTPKGLSAIKVKKK